MTGDPTLIYAAIKIKLDDTYPDAVERWRDSNKPGSCGIWLLDSVNQSKTVDGSTIFEACKVHVEVTCGPSAEEEDLALRNLTHFVNRLETEPCEIMQILFKSRIHNGQPAKILNNNLFDLKVAYCEVDLRYIFKNLY